MHDAAKWYFAQALKPTSDGLSDYFRGLWRNYRGKRGGFSSVEEESMFGKRGIKMLENFLLNINNVSAPLPPVDFPKYPLTENIVLHGNWDYISELSDGTLYVMDLKTGSKEEDDPTQLYIYAILAENHFGKPVSKISYWYLDRDDAPKEALLDPLEKEIDKLKKIGLEIQKSISEKKWVCRTPENPCRDCRDYAAVFAGEAEYLYTDFKFNKEVYYLPRNNDSLLTAIAAEAGQAAEKV